MKRNGNGRGKCVFTTAEEVKPREWFLEQPEVGDFKRIKTWREGIGWGSFPDPNVGLVVCQRGNGSIRLVYEIPKSEGGGAFRVFTLPRPYPTIGEPGFPKALTDREACQKATRQYLSSIGW